MSDVTDTPTPERGEPDRFEITPDFLPKRPQDFPEDFSHENGNYQCRCYRCGHYFVGHKRRVACKLCVTIGALTYERDALIAECARKDAEIAALRDALTHEDIKLVWVTQGHEEFGIECTICIGDEYETLTNQADPITAIIETSKAVRAKLNPGAPHDGE